ncbi:DUF6644 family protein [Candidatus Rariloculus sp.]|uniref:DUF6644 family protein n=1 Tax=Candidatus Rariloculus sp. TaxID=3101265 RepID=UPI003D0BCE03
MQALMEWIVSTPPSHFVTTYRWAWPISESLHFIGLALMAGTVGVFDLRLLGLAKGIRPGAMHGLLRWGMVGFGISLLTGLLFISGAPDQYFYNSAFHVKAICLALTGLNLVLFYRLQFTAVAAMGPYDDAPLPARVMGGISLALLIAVMCAGRLITFYRPPGIVF